MYECTFETRGERAAYTIDESDENGQAGWEIRLVDKQKAAD